MYFHDRAEAGDLLANQLTEYRYENTVVLALSPGGVLVGEQIARRLHTTLLLLVTERISAPGDDSLVLGTIDQAGVYTTNSLIAAGQMEEYMEDMRGWVEEEKMHKLYEMATVVNGDGLADPSQIKNRNVIITTDGVKNGMSFDAARHFLNKIHVERTIAAIPVGPGEVIERLSHQLDEVHYLNIPNDFFTVSHYYTDESDISSERVNDALDNVVTRWL
jgi:putative phosphoribosyl transferase